MNIPALWKSVYSTVVALVKKVPNGPGEHKIIAFGSGVMIDSRGIIVTARKVLEKEAGDLNKITLSKFGITFTFNNSEYAIAAEFGSVSIVDDLAFIFIFKEDYPSADMPMEGEIISEGQYIIGGGFPLMDKTIFPRLMPSLSHGIISQVDSERILLDIGLHRGGSGGPIFNVDTGKLIGIAVDEREDKITTTENANNLKVDYLENTVRLIDYRTIKLGLQFIEKMAGGLPFG